MLIEHDGKTIDTEKPIRFINERIQKLGLTGRDEKIVPHYVGQLRDGCHVVEYDNNVGRTFTYQTDAGMVQTFENVPQTHVRWINVYEDNSCGAILTTLELADANAETMAHAKRRIDCIRITWQN